MLGNNRSTFANDFIYAATIIIKFHAQCSCCPIDSINGDRIEHTDDTNAVL